jgi:hypothetical protein
MSQESTIGYVQLPASEVVSRAEFALADLLFKREESRKEFISNFTKEPTGRLNRLLHRRALTETEAIERIKADTWLGHEYYYLTPRFKSKRESQLESLIKVGNGLLAEKITDMIVTIEIADLLFSSNI